MITEEMVREIIERTYPELPLWIGTPEGDVIFIGYNPGAMLLEYINAYVIEGLRYELNENKDEIDEEIRKIMELETLGSLTLAEEEVIKEALKRNAYLSQFYVDEEDKPFYFINLLRPESDNGEYSEIIKFLLSLRNNKSGDIIPIEVYIGVDDKKLTKFENKLFIVKDNINNIKQRLENAVKDIAFKNPEQFALIKSVLSKMDRQITI